METIAELAERLRALEAAIEDCRGRMPAHSAKPAMVQELMDLEDERDRLLSEIRAIDAKDE